MFNFLSGALLALISAVLFGVSPVLIKLVSGGLPPVLMAGILYLGSGIGLLGFRFLRREPIFQTLLALPKKVKLQLAGAIICGGIFAPLCLTYGIFYSSAFQVSALLNMETVATTLIAGFIFREHISGRVWAGKVLVVIGAVLISMTGKADAVFSFSSLFIIGACIFWGLDNNITRDIEELPPSLLAGFKGLIAGLFNIVLALSLKQTAAGLLNLSIVLGIGAVSYGLSLVFFVYALRKIGASRTSTYFAAGPFIGMLAAVVFLGERPDFFHWAAGFLMLIGIWVLYLEHHEHEHTHEEMEHSHTHVRDEHHQHDHDGTEGPEPHEHLHKHTRLTHTHPHLPDIHHRHQH